MTTLATTPCDPVVAILVEAAARGRALRIAREIERRNQQQAQQPPADDTPRRDDTPAQHDETAHAEPDA